MKTSRAAGKEKRTGRRKSRTVSWGPEPGRQVPPHQTHVSGMRKEDGDGDELLEKGGIAGITKGLRVT